MLNGPDKVWLLGASTGGLHAVRDFLKLVPPDQNIGLVYAQHIDAPQMATLQRMIESQTSWSARVAATGEQIAAGRVTLIPPDSETRISDRGQWLRFTSGWHGRYAPSVDQLAKRLSALYRENFGVIIFTGMGDDGARGCRLVKDKGGQVWVQEPSQCTAPSMPESVLQHQCADFVGSIEQLAGRFNTLVGQPQACVS